MSERTQTMEDQPLEATVEGRVIYLLALVALVQFGYPITAYGTLALLLYQLLYASMIVVGVLVGRDSRRHRNVLLVTGGVYLAAGLVYALNPSIGWINVLTYLALIPYHSMLIFVLAHFIYGARAVTRDVLYAATAVYLLLGAIFVPLYGLVETFAPGSFVDGNAPAPGVEWQQLLYFSYTTLTTAGYGDIQPLSWWARSLTNLEMVVGMLYISVNMAWLVGLYTSARRSAKE